jgi:hypothetical protein
MLAHKVYFSPTVESLGDHGIKKLLVCAICSWVQSSAANPSIKIEAVPARFQYEGETYYILSGSNNVESDETVSFFFSARELQQLHAATGKKT